MKLPRFAPVFLVLAVSPASNVESGDLQAHTLEAFLRYARATEAELLEQVNSDEFLRIDYPGGIEDREEALARVRNGEVYIAKLKILDNGEEIDVRNGIVHHWYGAALVPNVTLDDVLALVKDYDTHAEVFAPDQGARGQRSRWARRAEAPRHGARLHVAHQLLLALRRACRRRLDRVLVDFPNPCHPAAPPSDHRPVRERCPQGDTDVHA